jgi:hypothetical protein
MSSVEAKLSSAPCYVNGFSLRISLANLRRTVEHGCIVSAPQLRLLCCHEVPCFYPEKADTARYIVGVSSTGGDADS